MTEKKLPKHLYNLFKLIPLGMDLPITGADLEKFTNTDIRTVKEHIRQLVVDYGIPVCGGRDSKSGGYYLPQNETERLAGVLPLQRQYDQEHKRINALLTADLQEWRKYRDV